ncbi:MAG: sulfurtransferase [Burkholderiales bacterium]
MFTTLVSVDQLAAHLDDPDWIVFDCRFDLADTAAGRRAYLSSHIPGARYAHLDDDLAGAKTGANGRHPLPQPEEFCSRMKKLGMRNGMQAVAYDASGGFYAARLWWMLRWVGHVQGAVLDGGWDEWNNAGLPVSAQAAAPAAGTFHCIAQDMTVDARFVQENLGSRSSVVIDARSADRFRGENETLDPVGGHIPGALNRFFKSNLAADGRFKPVAELRAEFVPLLGTLPPQRIVHQCGSGVTACHNLLAMEIAGLHGSRLYPGSWSEWCSDLRRPVTRSPVARGAG